MFSGRSRDFGWGLARAPLPAVLAAIGEPLGATTALSCPAGPREGAGGGGVWVSTPPGPRDQPLAHVFLMGFCNQEIASWCLACKVIGRRPAKVYNLPADEDEVLV